MRVTKKIFSHFIQQILYHVLCASSCRVMGKGGIVEALLL
jgi:hypothetical protein